MTVVAGKPEGFCKERHWWEGAADVEALAGGEIRELSPPKGDGNI